MLDHLRQTHELHGSPFPHGQGRNALCKTCITYFSKSNVQVEIVGEMLSFLYLLTEVKL